MTQQPNANGRSNGPGRDDDKKLFVGGLGRTISEKELREYFTQYGEIENINIKTDPFSGQSRGFAFVQFVNAKTVDDLLAAGDHFIANKKVDPKRVSCVFSIFMVAIKRTWHPCVLSPSSYVRHLKCFFINCNSMLLVLILVQID